MTVSMLLAWAIIIGIFYVVGKILYNLVTGGRTGVAKHCMTCGHEGTTKMRTRGSILIEIVLWICLIVPGLIYSIWRISTRQEVCTNCGASNVIPLNSPEVLAAKAAKG